MPDNPEVEIIVACGYGDVGHRLRPNGVVRDWIVGNGYGKVVEAASPARRAVLSAGAAAKLGAATAKKLIGG